MISGLVPRAGLPAQVIYASFLALGASAAMVGCSGQGGAPAGAAGQGAVASESLSLAGLELAKGMTPMPGADLDGPIGTPAEQAAGNVVRRTRASDEIDAITLDLGRDRVAQPVDLPTPPRGGAVSFAFGDARRGWVARVPESRQLPSAAYGDGKVYISGGFDSVNFYAMDAETGRFEWATTNLEDNGPTAAIYDEGRVIFNTESCTLFALDARTGKRLWYKWLGDPTLAQTAVADGLIFAAHPVGGTGGSDARGTRLSAYQVESGKRVWSRAISGELLAAPVVHGDSVYASTIRGKTHRFKRRGGERVWARRLRATTAPWLVGNELFVSRRKDGREEQVVVSADTGRVLREHHAVVGSYLGDVPRDLDDWRKVWEFEGSRPVVAGGVRYVAMGGEVHATDSVTGGHLWVRRHAASAGKRSIGSVALAGPQVVLSTRSGQIFGLDIDTGYTLWAYDIGRAIVAQPIVARGWVYLTSKDGYVVALEVGDTTLDGWHMFGGNPQHNGVVSSPQA